MKAIIFANTPDNPNTTFSCMEGEKLRRLKELCRLEKLEVVKEFGEGEFNHLRKFVASHKNPVDIVCYHQTAELRDLQWPVTRIFAHDCVYEPAKSQKLWRNMQLWKFEYLLNRQSLYFSRIDALRNQDKNETIFCTGNQYSEWVNIVTKFLGEHNILFNFENASSQEIIDLHRRLYSVGVYSADYRVQNNNHIAKIMIVLYQHKQHEEKYKYEYFVNCWHMGNSESDGMREVYGPICVESTFDDLFNCFTCPSYSPYQKQNAYLKINISQVKYIDFDKEDIPIGNAKWALTHKHHIYIPENEVRCIIWKPDAQRESDDGLKISVDLKRLIKKVHISENLGQSDTDKVIGLCEKHELSYSLSEATSSILKMTE